MSDGIQRAAELAARASYGRLLAGLAARTRDIAAAEDALSEAFLAALLQWPRDGVPANPDGWLVTAARRRLLDARRREVVRSREADAVAAMIAELAARPDTGGSPIADDRLRLLFVCTHPAIDGRAQVPLMLQAVLGLDAEAIASALRVAPKTMGQRLWRAKAKIRDAGIPFEVPAHDELASRVAAVLEAIYAAFGTAWDDVAGADPSLRGLGEEAILLGRLVVELLPAEPEALGLLALMLFADARRPARRDASGRYVPLDAQDPGRWSGVACDEAERLLGRAFALGRIGPFQLEAAIQAAHVDAVRRGRTDHQAIATLYEGLVALAPSLGARVGHAAATLDASGPGAALALLDTLASDPAATTYQPYWAVRAEVLHRAGRGAEAGDAYERAVGLSEDEATREFLRARAARPVG